MTATADGRLDPEYDSEPVAVEERLPADALTQLVLAPGGRPWEVAGPEPGGASDPESTPSVQDSPLDRAAIEDTLNRATAHLLSLQDEQGWWKGNLETNVTMDAEDLLLRQFLGIRTEAQTNATAEWIRSQQREDGTWSTFHGGPPEISTTVEAYVALRLAGDQPEASHMRAAAEFVREAGGIAATRVFTRIWLALFGWWPWERLPEMPPRSCSCPSGCR